ncbi:MFS transporter [Pediococcus acidilactici]|uniref:MFS transporter n=1 Tax=Pediococcus acidilactici TaxID=1254 RepID=UPI000FF7A269|nr:MFS transporter [Pediococcus acidilactici]KAF0340477.1 MFS transporter [Pediococcus acidilactici]KAF0352397.1 MFS transporter [Pediococcus acidilactici]KAF0356232.1 MFS transporter [Pediococcus acidilactici]KAF0360849.1 MFS transporter [Pediococcus acidilactici]KAF0374425.1 MFS transporter [Pediococcus acidilactici]
MNKGELIIKHIFQKFNLKRFFLIFFVSLFLVLPQIINQNIILGNDAIFHFNRFYDSYMQFKTGNFSYFQTNYGFQQSGRIVNALYGPLIAYILGGILFLVHSWLKFQIIVSYLTFFVSGYTMNLLSRKVGLSNRWSNINSLLFMGSMWVGRWALEQNFMSLGIMLMPLVVLMGINLLNNDLKTVKIVQLAMVVSLIIQIHVLSAVISVLVLMIFFVVAVLKNRNKWDLFLRCVGAGVLSLVLTFNVWGPMLEIYSSNNLYTPFKTVLSESAINISTGDADFRHIGLVISVLFVLQIAYYCLYHSDMSFINRIVTGIGIFMLVISSNVFPWELVDRKLPFLKSLLQFPIRFEGMAFILLILGLSLTLSSVKNEDVQKIALSFFMMAAIFGLIQTNRSMQLKSEIWNSKNPVSDTTNMQFQTKDPKAIRNAFRGRNLKKGLEILQKPNTDYVSAPNTNKKTEHPYYQYDKDFLSTDRKVNKTVKSDQLLVTWIAHEDNSTTKLPITVYKNSVLKLNGHSIKPKQITFDPLNVPSIKTEKKGKNTLSLRYSSRFMNKYFLWGVYAIWGVLLLQALKNFLKRIR